MNTTTKRLHLLLISCLILALVAGAGLFIRPKPLVAATIEQLQQQVAELEADISANEKKLSQVRAERETLEGEVYVLDVEIDSLTKKIDMTNAKIDKLDLEIAEAEEELAYQEGILAESLRELYKRGNVTTVELLASSDSYSDFINEQEYLSRIKLAIQESAAKVSELKDQLENSHAEAKDLAEQLDGQRRIVDNKRTEKANLLAETRGVEAAYQDRKAALQKEQEQLLAEIVSRSQVISGVGTGSYPWANFHGSSWSHAASCTYADDGDPWGYCYRQCVSFAAWRLYSTGKTPPQWYGDAQNWDDAARADGVPTGSQPKVGAIAVWNIGAWGHVAYVEEINDNGTVRISEYNAVPSLGGMYSQRIINKNDPSTYIYFE